MLNTISIIFQSVIKRELLENMKVFEFELDSEDMKAISYLNKNLRLIVPINKLKSGVYISFLSSSTLLIQTNIFILLGEIVLRDGKSRHFPFTFDEPILENAEPECYVRQDPGFVRNSSKA